MPKKTWLFDKDLGKISFMGHAKLKADLGIDEYLKGEELSPVRHEYLYGKVYAMTGTSQNHNRITRNFSNRLFNGLSGSLCEVYSENIKVCPTEEVFLLPRFDRYLRGRIQE